MKKLLLILWICISVVFIGSPAGAEIEYDNEYYEYFDDEDYGVGLYKLFILKDNEPVEAITMMETTKQNLTVRPYPTKANGNVRWHSSDEEVATVDEKGTVTAVGTGSCKIYAVSKISSAKKDYVTVNVIQYRRNPDKITLTPEAGAVFETGNKVKLIPTFYPEDTTERTLRWFAFGNAATIDQNGVLSIKDKGTVKVRAVSFDWSVLCDYEIKINYAQSHFTQIGQAYNVNNSRAVVFEFDSDIAVNSAYSNVFSSTSEDGNGDNIDIDITVNGKFLTVKPKTQWSAGNSYIFIKSGLKDTSGNMLGDNCKYMIQVRREG